MKIWWFPCIQYWNNGIVDRTCNYRCNESIIIKQKGHLYRYGRINTRSINNNEILLRFDHEFSIPNNAICRHKRVCFLTSIVWRFIHIACETCWFIIQPQFDIYKEEWNIYDIYTVVLSDCTLIYIVIVLIVIVEVVVVVLCDNN